MMQAITIPCSRVLQSGINHSAIMITEQGERDCSGQSFFHVQFPASRLLENLTKEWESYKQLFILLSVDCLIVVPSARRRRDCPRLQNGEDCQEDAVSCRCEVSGPDRRPVIAALTIGVPCNADMQLELTS